jgi:hypothetical protein
LTLSGTGVDDHDVELAHAAEHPAALSGHAGLRGGRRLVGSRRRAQPGATPHDLGSRLNESCKKAA